MGSTEDPNFYGIERVQLCEISLGRQKVNFFNIFFLINSSWFSLALNLVNSGEEFHGNAEGTEMSG